MGLWIIVLVVGLAALWLGNAWYQRRAVLPSSSSPRWRHRPAPPAPPLEVEDVGQLSEVLHTWKAKALRWSGTHKETLVAAERLGEAELRLRVGLSSRLPGDFVVNRRDATPLPEELRESFIYMETVERFGLASRLVQDDGFTEQFLVSAASEDIGQIRHLLAGKLRKALMACSLAVVLTEDEVLYSERRDCGSLSDTDLRRTFDELARMAERVVAIVGKEAPEALASGSDVSLHGHLDDFVDPRGAAKRPRVPPEVAYAFLPQATDGGFECELSSVMAPGEPPALLRIDDALRTLSVASSDGGSVDIDLTRGFGAMLSYSLDVGGRSLLHFELRQQSPRAGRWVRLGVSCRAESFDEPVHGLEELARRYPYVSPEDMLELLARVRFVRESIGVTTW